MAAPREWSPAQQNLVEILVEETSSLGVWLMLEKESHVEAEVVRAYGNVKVLPDALSELEYD